MSWRGQLSRNLFGILFSPKPPSSSPTIAFIGNNYKDLKTKNPKLPILIGRQLWARYENCRELRDDPGKSVGVGICGVRREYEVMEASSCSSNPQNPSQKGKGENGKCRRVWTKEEELALLGALKELKGSGFNVDNAISVGLPDGIKGIYLFMLEDLIKKVLPDTDIRAEPHVKSKLIVWKRTYSDLYTLFERSGGGSTLDEKTKMINVVTEDFWREYVRVHPYVASYRMKRFPYYDEWADVFRKDWATGAGADYLSAAVQESLNSHNMGSFGSGQSSGANVSSQSQQNPIDLDSYEGEGDNDLPIPGPPPFDAKLIYKKVKKEKGVKKRKSSSVSDTVGPEVPPYMDEFIKKTQDGIERIAELVVKPRTHEDMAAAQRKTIFTTLEAIPDFDDDQRMVLAHKLAHSPEDADIFFTMPEKHRPKYLKMLLKMKAVR